MANSRTVIEEEKPQITCKKRMKSMCRCLNFDTKKCCCKCYLDCSGKVKALMDSDALTIIIILILLNSLVLATEHYD